MDNDSPDTTMRLGNAAVTVQHGEGTSRFKVHTASLRVLPGPRPVHLRLEGPGGSVIVELSREAFWQLTAQFHERSIAVEDPDAKQRGRRS